MILTGNEIELEVTKRRIVIEPYNKDCIEPNSYRFHLGSKLMVYRDDVVDAYESNKDTHVTEIEIPKEGYVLHPKQFYLGHTVERMGSHIHASELYARLSTSSTGIFIQTSAPLGHTGAIIPWTLEILTLLPVRVYAGMPIGKICFWCNKGEVKTYAGRYKDSRSVVSSMMSGENP
ncbi:dCTP deaminase [Paraburkholderia acidisoli]|uniref:Deoxycytidine triphosphate deaminase n=1 Tax=Paraburkholderia acidisoli TaxID=2571748 RepID=A0A7Z2JHY6_9BURK|nr:deoxycytidine triphosphate deaminase [Paraburkholderia acidisoli]QGZ64598.1 deoxycytidine triphosphate deaminase [Paraburkholderia acidisoli]